MKGEGWVWLKIIGNIYDDFSIYCTRFVSVPIMFNVRGDSMVLTNTMSVIIGLSMWFFIFGSLAVLEKIYKR